MISIITPVLNGENFIIKILESVSHLTIHYEHIIVDGGSSDRTLEICKKYPNIRVLHQNINNGMYGAIQQGFNNAKGDWLCWINCDDWIEVNNFERLFKNTLNGGYNFGYGSATIVNTQDVEYIDFKSKPFGRFLLRNGIFPFVQPSSVYNKSLVHLVNGLDFDNFKIAGDIDFFIRMSKLNEFKAYRSKEICTYFLKYGDSLGDREHERYLNEKVKLPRPMHGILGRFLARIIYYVT